MGLFNFGRAKQVKSDDTTKSASITFDSDKNISQFANTFNYGTSSRKYNDDVFLLLYDSTPQLSAIINYIATKAAEIPVRHMRFDKNGEKMDLGETELLKLLQTPNEIDNETKFKQDLLMNILVFGNAPISKMSTPGFNIATKIYNEPANRIFAIPQHSIDMYGNPNNAYDNHLNPVIKYKKLLGNGAMTDIEKENMIYIRDLNPSKIGRDYYYGQSRIYAATRTIDVIGNIYDTINTVLANRGALGFIKRNVKANEVDPGMYQAEIERLEKEYTQKYGVKGSQIAMMMTFSDLSFERISMPINEFQPIELTAQEFDTLCNQMWGFPSALLNSKAASTYNNVTQLERAFYVNTLKPLLTLAYNGLSDGLGISKNNEWLVPDFSGVECLQESQKVMAEAINEKMLYLEKLQSGGYITKNKVLSEIGFNEVDKPEFNNLTNGQIGAQESK